MIDILQGFSIANIIAFGFVISMIINSINVCFWENHIFQKIGDRFEDYKIWKPIAGCIICMSPWWGSAMCFVFGWPFLSIMVCMGINTVIVRMEPKD